MLERIDGDDYVHWLGRRGAEFYVPAICRRGRLSSHLKPALGEVDTIDLASAALRHLYGLRAGAAAEIEEAFSFDLLPNVASKKDLDFTSLSIGGTVHLIRLGRGNAAQDAVSESAVEDGHRGS
ncbi:MAG: hypothetical protein WBG09_07860 [Candidatus Sulfotelmatobacter sp.]